ncbi:hypothetical protein COX86_03885 [Candidatus Micrarchaeota archaeon CG_4_10_14_0_2_um_filter_60_11]|nr:MAG: hypothetical protein COX86_03885 [Candidatus Micrarchaeota archaeon CG_4_10_14_0_2_um_filter_60_11]
MLVRGSLLQVDVVRGGIFRLALLTRNGTKRVYDDSFKPYFYYAGVEAPRGFKSERVKKLVAGKERELFKVYCRKPGDVPASAELLRNKAECFEYDIPFQRRYLVDKGITPCDGIEVETEERNGRQFVKAIKRVEGEPFAPKTLAFDIETYNERGISEPTRDPCLMIGYADEEGTGLLEQGPRGFKTEKEMLEAFAALLREKRVDLLCTYNGDEFDLPYLKERAVRTGAVMRLGRDKAPVHVKRLGIRNRAGVGGRTHFDVYDAVYFLNYIGAIRLERMRLEDVYRELLGGKKVEIKKEEIWKLWKAGDSHVGEYCKVDALACFQLAKRVMPQEIELSRITGSQLFDSTRATAGQHVEALLTRKAFEYGELLPNKPSHSQTAARSQNPIEGAFVKVPDAGVYENIAVFDFRSLYPSIIVTHNVDPTTLNCSCCEDAFVSPKGHRFCKKKPGLIPRVLGEVLETRFKIKAEEKKAVGAKKEELHARQWALKIIANSFYGYTVYPRSRWYSRECGESVTAWARHYIQDAIRQAEEYGFKVLYGDTDSVFLTFKSGEEGKVKAFKEKVNETLPGNMELELEDLYPRGIFVSKKQGEKGAKKKYALINAEGKIKIRGFELVRRDWSPVARHTQRRILEILLKKGDVEEAVKLVRDKIAELKEGKVPLTELAIITSLRKKADSYAIKSPELGAVLEARKAGEKVDEEAPIEYVITTSGKTVSEKARLLSRAKDYDADYYVQNQVLPAVLKILGALGLSEDDLLTKGRQKGLGDW